MNYTEITKLLREVPAYEAYRSCWQNQRYAILARGGVILLEKGHQVQRVPYIPEVEDVTATDWEINPFCNSNDMVYA